MRRTAIVAALVSMGLLACGKADSPRTLQSICSDYCAKRVAAGCPKVNCESACTHDLAACPATCFDQLATMMDCAVTRMCGTDAGEQACLNEMTAAAACDPECQ